MEYLLLGGTESATFKPMVNSFSSSSSSICIKSSFKDFPTIKLFLFTAKTSYLFCNAFFSLVLPPNELDASSQVLLFLMDTSERPLPKNCNIFLLCIGLACSTIGQVVLIPRSTCCATTCLEYSSNFVKFNKLFSIIF